VLIEAMSHGRPVLVSAMGGLRDVQESRVGWAVSPTSADFAKGLAVLHDREQLSLRGATGRRTYLAHHTPEQVTSELIDVYERVLSDSARR
jgi:glycosyltransferase involved in cell wall biosynthesis